MPFEPLKFLINQVKTAVGNLTSLKTPQPDVVTALNAHTDQIANVATVITSTTNNSGHAISSGEYFIANGAKYKATATIDTGATWSDKSISVSDHDLINALNNKITLSPTWHANLNKVQLHAYRYGKVVSIKGKFSVTGDIANGETLLTNLPSSGMSISNSVNMMCPVRSAEWNMTVAKWHGQALASTYLINVTTKLVSGDFIQIDLTYIAE